MQVLAVVLAACVASVLGAVNAELEKNVYVGTDANLHDLIDSAKYVLVEFCAWKSMLTLVIFVITLHADVVNYLLVDVVSNCFFELFGNELPCPRACPYTSIVCLNTSFIDMLMLCISDAPWCGHCNALAVGFSMPCRFFAVTQSYLAARVCRRRRGAAQQPH